MIQRRLLFLRKYSLLFKQFVAYVKGDGGVVESVDYLYSKFTQAPNASILQIPTSYKTSVLYNQEPFNPSEDFDVIRNSTVNRIAPNGLLEEIGVNVPCIDYATGEPLLLTQPQSTNFVTYSEDFSNVSWSKIKGGIGSVPILDFGYTSPKGTLNATKITLDKGSSTSLSDFSSLKFDLTQFDGVVSIYLKGENGGEDVTLLAKGSDLGTFTLTSQWVRYEVYSSQAVQLTLRLRGDVNINNVATFYAWGAQAEGQPFATSHIETNGSVATRLADVIENAGSTNTINSEEGVFHFKSAAFFEGETYRNISISDGTSSNFILFRYDLIDNQVRAFYKNNNVTEGAIIKDNVNVLDINSFDLIWNDETLKLYVNEVFHQSVSLSNTFSANTLSKVDFYLAGNNFEAKTKELRVYKSIAEAQIDLPYIT